MDNFTWIAPKGDKSVVKEVRYIIPRDEFATSKNDLLTKCEDLEAVSEALYAKAPNKELYDAIVTLHSVKKSLNSIYIKEETDDKREDCRVPESAS